MGFTFLILTGFFLAHRDIEDSILYMSRAGYHFSYHEWYTMPNSRFRKLNAAAIRYYKEKAKKQKEAEKNNKLTLDEDDEED